jgi:hypothetical protein
MAITELGGTIWGFLENIDERDGEVGRQSRRQDGLVLAGSLSFSVFYSAGIISRINKELVMVERILVETHTQSE